MEYIYLTPHIDIVDIKDRDTFYGIDFVVRENGRLKVMNERFETLMQAEERLENIDTIIGAKR